MILNLKELEHALKRGSIVLTVTGNPIAHSWSPRLHQHFLDEFGIRANYYAVQINRAEDFPTIVELLEQYPNYLGSNITLPFKKRAASLDLVKSAEVEATGAANIFYKRGDKIELGNTDLDGFLYPLKEKQLAHKKLAFVLGTGGAAQAVLFALKRFGFQDTVLVSRNPDSSSKQIDYEKLENRILEASLLVNTTPVGMYPDTTESPLSEQVFAKCSELLVYDLIYNPYQTQLLNLAKYAGLDTIGGLHMFAAQASISFEKWFDRDFSIDEAVSVLISQT